MNENGDSFSGSIFEGAVGKHWKGLKAVTLHVPMPPSPEGVTEGLVSDLRAAIAQELLWERMERALGLPKGFIRSSREFGAQGGWSAHPVWARPAERAPRRENPYTPWQPVTWDEWMLVFGIQKGLPVRVREGKQSRLVTTPVGSRRGRRERREGQVAGADLVSAPDSVSLTGVSHRRYAPKWPVTSELLGSWRRSAAWIRLRGRLMETTTGRKQGCEDEAIELLRAPRAPVIGGPECSW